MADKKIEKALYGPSTVEVALGAFLGFLLGLIAAVVFLVFKPVQLVKEMPKEPVANVVYYLPGSENSTKAKNWQAKQKTFINGGDVIFNEEELNAWATSVNAPAASPAPAPAAPAKGAKTPAAKPEAKAEEKKDQPAAASAGFLVPSGLNFKIKKDKLQVGLKCKLDYYGIGTEVLVVATGSFAKSGDHYVFQPDTFYFGSCPLHKLPAASSFVAGRIVSALKIPEDVRLAWDKVSSIAVEGDLLKATTTQ